MRKETAVPVVAGFRASSRSGRKTFIIMVRPCAVRLSLVPDDAPQRIFDHFGEHGRIELRRICNAVHDIGLGAGRTLQGFRCGVCGVILR